MSATPRTHRAELAASEARLQASLDEADEWATQPSGLPGWSRGHVIAHLIGNAEGMINLTRWAATGVETPMYPSIEAKDAQIGERAGLPLRELRELLAGRSAELAAACDGMAEPLAERSLRLASGAQIDAWEIPMLRMREVEIHSVDLAAGYLPADWPIGFSLRTIDQVLPFMVSRRDLAVSALVATDTGRAWAAAADGVTLFGPEAELLAWLIGRPFRALSTHSDQPLPPTPRWV